MVGAFGEVQVMDWGLAKVLDHGGAVEEEQSLGASQGDLAVRTLRCGSEELESRVGSVLGTPSYMAPEQARGELDTLDERADVFALGSILCEILTGRPAFAGGAAADVYRKAERADLSDASARLDACESDAELVGLARSCLAAAPKHRPRDAGAVAARLTAYLGGVERRLREAELAQARAEARAAGERKRRLLALALAASVLATALIGVAGWAWNDRERRRRERSIRAGVDVALSEASKKRDQARDAGGADPVAWVEAIAAARRAESLLGGDDAGSEWHDRVRAFMAELVRERDAVEGAEKDRRMVERLAAIQNDLGVHNDVAKADAEYAAAFRAYGVDPDRMEPEAAGRTLAASPAAVDLANALDNWAFLRRGPALRGPAGAARLVAAARTADPDPWRSQLRDTLGRMGRDRARRLEVLERLADTADVAHLPGASVTRLAAALAFLGKRDMGIELLRRAQSSHRDDFWVNADLGRELMISGRAEEAVRFFDVAACVRPRSGLALRGLGKALFLSGQPSEAADILREVTRLRPDDALAHVALGSAFLMLGKPHEADAEFGEARRLRPDDWVVRDQIALAFSDRGDWAAAVEEQRESARRFPGLAVVHKALAHALEGAGRTDDAIAEFREAVRLEPRFPSAYLYLGRALIEAGDYRAARDALARVDPGPPPPDPNLSRVDSGFAGGAPDRAGGAIACHREWARPSCRGGNGRGIRPARLLPAFLRGGGPPVGGRVRRLADIGGRPDHGEPLSGRTSRGVGRCRERPTRKLARCPLRCTQPRAGRGLVGGRPRRVRRRPGIRDLPAASHDLEAAGPVAGRPGPGGTPRRAGRGRDSRAREPFASRTLAPDRCIACEGRRYRPAGARPEQESVRDTVTSGGISLIWCRGSEDPPPGRHCPAVGCARPIGMLHETAARHGPSDESSGQ